MAVESLKTLRRRVRSVKNIKQITRAMGMVAASKLRRTQSRLLAARPYAAKLQELLGHLAGSSGLSTHPLFMPREGDRKLLVLFTADRGLCGSFNTNIIKMAEDHLKANPKADWSLACIGRRGQDHFANRGRKIIDTISDLGGVPDSDQARDLSHRILERFLDGQFDSVHLLFTRYISAVRYQPTIVQYLPMTPESLGIDPQAQTSHEIDYLLEPSAEAVIDSLLPRHLSSKIYITMAESMTSEHSARMLAMNNATKNCTEMSDHLTLKLNKARQATITKDLLDIVGGAEALKS